MLSKTLIELKGYHILKDSVIKAYSKDIWDEVKDNVFTDGQKPVRGIAILKCRWGGVITIELTGQPEG